MGEEGVLSTVSGRLGSVLYDLERFPEADEMTAYAQEITPVDDVASIVLWQSNRARLLARSGDYEQAIRLAESAVALDETTDALNDRAHTLLEVAEVLRLSGRPDEARRRHRAGSRPVRGEGQHRRRGHRARRPGSLARVVKQHDASARNRMHYERTDVRGEYRADAGPDAAESALVERFLPAGSSVLDLGCGNRRVALARWIVTQCREARLDPVCVCSSRQAAGGVFPRRTSRSAGSSTSSRSA